MREGWRKVRVSDVAQVIGGGTPKTFHGPYWDGDIPWITPKDLSDRPALYTAEGSRSITEAGVKGSGAQWLPAGTVLLSTRAPIGYVTIAARPLTTNQGFKSLVLADGQLPEYWYYLLSGSTEYLRSRAPGSTFPELSKRAVEALEFALPPVQEQRRIVDLMGHIDAMIHATTLSLDALRASREAALSDWIPLVPESGTPLSSVSTITDCEHKTAPTAKEHESVAGRVIGTPAIRDGRIISAEARPVSAATYSEWTGRRVPHQGDVVLTREAPVGQAALIREEHGPLCLGQRTVLLSPGSSYDSAFLLSLLMSPAYQRWLRGASVSQTVERINVKRLSEMPVPQLPVEAQRAVGAQLEAMLEAEDRGVDEIERLRALRAACLSALVTGSHEIPSAYDEFLSDEGWRDGVR